MVRPAMAALALAPGLAAQSRDEEFRLRAVVVETRNVFGEEEVEENLFYRLVNGLHWPTLPEVVERELWFGPGDRVDRETVDELERNLRAFSIFGGVESEIVPTGEGDMADLLVRTRDKFSLIASASGSVVGGVTKLRARLGEGNLLGKAKRLVVSYEQEEDDLRATVSYTDRQLLESWYQMTAAGGQTSDGSFGNLVVERPFKHLLDPLRYGIALGHEERDLDYFRSGERVAELPEDRTDARLFLEHARGPRDLRGAAGIDLRYRDSRYSPATGPAAPAVRVPGDTSEAQLGLTFRFDKVESYREVVGLDTLDFVQDLTLGISGSLRPAVVLRDEEGRGSEAQALLEADLRAAGEILPETFLTAELGGRGRWHAGDLVAWAADAKLHAFQLSLPSQTLAWSLTFDGVFDGQDPAPQLTLGEDSGLRGYPAREFAGSRIVRLNLEDRIATGLELLSMHLGVVAFFDAGWVHGRDQGLSQGDPIRGAGIGLRFGSSNLLGDDVVRIDFAWPLDEVGGEEFGPSLSLSAGQVFTFFGNATELRRDFGR